eukprot:TRINITY_DN20328_c0_g2_i1.p1 TRINITY_DN20328_c0_g2~~TRINITY_DN20328_c0_g2_i1.p1  ORF type:complete len:589 (+),score=138.48 TRINITY_DN20328_c0_g2_i1:65-1831(+)
MRARSPQPSLLSQCVPPAPPPPWRQPAVLDPHVSKPPLAAAESLLLAELGAEAVQTLKPYYGALLGVADLAATAGGPQLRSLLRHLGELTDRIGGMEDAVHHWRTGCEQAQAQLAKVNVELSGAQQALRQERARADALQARFAGLARDREASEKLSGGHIERLQAGLAQAQTEVLRCRAEGDVHFRNIAEGQAVVKALNEEIRRLRVELEVVGTRQRQQEHDLEVERRRAAGSDISAELASKENARLEAALRSAGDYQRKSLEVARAKAEEDARQLRLHIEGWSNKHQGVRRAMSTLEETFAEVQSVAPCVLAAVEFLRDSENPAAVQAKGPESLAPGGPAAVRVPVLALRWPPGASLNTTPGWQALREGIYGLFHQLQTGAMLPDQVELSICEAEGRWFVSREDDSFRFAALLLYQALHRDAPVSVMCRVTTSHELLGLPKSDLVQYPGLGVRSTGALWRTPPANEEDFLKAVTQGSTLREALVEFFYQQRRKRVEGAWEDEQRQDPTISRPSWLQGPAAEAEAEAAAYPGRAPATLTGGAPAGIGGHVMCQGGPFDVQAATTAAAAQAAAAAKAASARRLRKGNAI